MAYRGIVGKMPPLDHNEVSPMGSMPMDAISGADDEGAEELSHEELAQSVAHHKAMPINKARRAVNQIMNPKVGPPKKRK